MDLTTHSSAELQQAVDAYWETFPPLWRSIQAHIRQAASDRFNITVEQFHILRHLSRGLDSVSALAEMRGISSPAASQMVDVLVTRGLVNRTVDPQDRRHICLALTEEGSWLVEAVFEDTRRWMMEKFSPLSPNDLRAFLHLSHTLKKIVES